LYLAFSWVAEAPALDHPPNRGSSCTRKRDRFDPTRLPIEAKVRGAGIAETPPEEPAGAFNEIGSLVWELIDGRRSDAEIAAAVRREVTSRHSWVCFARHLAYEPE
jgi:Coenzyme PQQ synthesis protein D (PqqD)